MKLLRHKADRRSVAFLTAQMALIAWAMTTPHMTFAIGAVVSCVLTVLFFSSAISGHNAMHAPVFVNKTLNRAWQCLLSMGLGHPTSAFVPAHNMSHHHHLQTPLDVLRTTEVRFKHNGLNFLAYLATAPKHMFATDMHFYAQMWRKRSPWLWQLAAETVATLGFFALVLATDWRRAIVFVVLPSQLGLRFIIGLGYPQHDGTDAKSKYDHSRNFTGWLFNYIAFNNGYHGIHHMKAGLHWSLTAEAHVRDLKPHQHPALDEPSILRYYFRAYVYPARRERYDGQPIVLPPKTQNAHWFAKKDELAEGTSFGVADA